MCLYREGLGMSIKDNEYWVKNGYTIVRMSRKEHNKLLPTKINIFRDGRYFLRVSEEKMFAFYTKANILGKIFATMLLPITIIVEGLSNIEGVWQSYLKILDGCYSSIIKIDKVHKIELIEEVIKIDRA